MLRHVKSPLMNTIKHPTSYFPEAAYKQLFHAIKEGRLIDIKNLFNTYRYDGLSLERKNPTHKYAVDNCSEEFLCLNFDNQPKMNPLVLALNYSRFEIFGFLLDEGALFSLFQLKQITPNDKNKLLGIVNGALNIYLEKRCIFTADIEKNAIVINYLVRLIDLASSNISLKPVVDDYFAKLSSSQWSILSSMYSLSIMQGGVNSSFVDPIELMTIQAYIIAGIRSRRFNNRNNFVSSEIGNVFFKIPFVTNRLVNEVIKYEKVNAHLHGLVDLTKHTYRFMQLLKPALVMVDKYRELSKSSIKNLVLLSKIIPFRMKSVLFTSKSFMSLLVYLSESYLGSNKFTATLLQRIILDHFLNKDNIVESPLRSFNMNQLKMALTYHKNKTRNRDMEVPSAVVDTKLSNPVGGLRLFQSQPKPAKEIIEEGSGYDIEEPSSDDENNQHGSYVPLIKDDSKRSRGVVLIMEENTSPLFHRKPVMDDEDKSPLSSKQTTPVQSKLT